MADLTSRLDLNIRDALAQIGRVESRARSIDARVSIRIANDAAVRRALGNLTADTEVEIGFVAPDLGDLETRREALGDTLTALVIVEDNGTADQVNSELNQAAQTRTAPVIAEDNGTVGEIATELGQLSATRNVNVLASDQGTIGALEQRLSQIQNTIGGIDSAIAGLDTGGGGGGPLGGLGRLTLLGAGAGLLASPIIAFQQLTSAADDADQALREVASLQIPNFGLTEARDTVTELTEEIGVASSRSIPALYQALSAGVPPGNVFDFLVESNQLASAGVAELEPTVRVLAGTINAYAEQGLTAADASNALFGAVQSGVTTIPELASQLGQVTSIAASAGVSFVELTAGIASITQTGTSTNIATTQIRSLIVELTTETSKAAQAFDDLTGTSFREFTAAGGTVEEALRVLNDEAESSGGSIDSFFGSVEAASAALALSRENGEAYADTIANITGIVDDGTAVSNAFEINQASLGATIDRVRAQLGGLAETLGQALIPTLNRAADGLENVVVPAAQVFVDTLLGVDEGAAGVSAQVERAQAAFNLFVEPIGTVTTGLQAADSAMSTFVDVEGILPLASGLGEVAEQSSAVSATGEQFASFATFIRDDAVPALVSLAEFTRDEVIPFMEAAGRVIGTVGTEALVGLARFAREDAIPALQEIGTVIVDELNRVFDTDLPNAVGTAESSLGGEEGITQTLVGLTNTITDDILPAAADFAVVLTEEVVPAAADVTIFVRDDLIPVLRDTKDAYDTLQPAIALTVSGLQLAAQIAGAFVASFTPVQNLVANAADGFDTLAGAIGRVASALGGVSLSRLNPLNAVSVGAGSLIPGNARGDVITRPTVTLVGEGGVWADRREIIAPLGSMGRTVDLFSQANAVGPLIAELARRDLLPTAVGARSAVAVMPGGFPPPASAVIHSTNHVTIQTPPGMTPTAAARVFNRQTRRAAERAAARDFHLANPGQGGGR